MVVSQAWKAGENAANPSPLYFDRDSNQREIDLVRETGEGLDLYEFKSGRCIAAEWFKHLAWGKDHLARVRKCHLVKWGRGDALPIWDPNPFLERGRFSRELVIRRQFMTPSINKSFHGHGTIYLWKSGTNQKMSRRFHGRKLASSWGIRSQYPIQVNPGDLS